MSDGCIRHLHDLMMNWVIIILSETWLIAQATLLIDSVCVTSHEVGRFDGHLEILTVSKFGVPVDDESIHHHVFYRFPELKRIFERFLVSVLALISAADNRVGILWVLLLERVIFKLFIIHHSIFAIIYAVYFRLGRCLLLGLEELALFGGGSYPLESTSCCSAFFIGSI